MIEFWTTRMDKRGPDTTFELSRADQVSGFVFGKLFVALTPEEQLQVATSIHCNFKDSQFRRRDYHRGPFVGVQRVDNTTIRGRTSSTDVFLKCPHFEGPW